MRWLDSSSPECTTWLQQISSQPPVAAEVLARAAEMLAAIRDSGDAAVLGYAQTLDGTSAKCIEALRADTGQLQRALVSLAPSEREALELAVERVRNFHHHQQHASWEYQSDRGVVLGQRITPVQRAGLYVPGGRAGYPSTVLMNAIPAQVAGVEEILLVSPAPDPSAIAAPVLAAAALIGVEQVYALGGVQAIGALAYGTETIARVDIIAGPGNQWVTAAKQLVYGVVGIDGLAGPSEVLVIGDGSVEPRWVALDLLAQAEHDEMARALLVSPDGDWMRAVIRCIDELLPEQPRGDIIRASLERSGAAMVVTDLEEAITIANSIAPEHLQLAVAEPRALLERVRNAGAIFLGSYASEALGDYLAGPSHVLPTGGTARFASSLGVETFLKRSSVIEFDAPAAISYAWAVAALARMEGLEAHAQAVESRAGNGGNQKP